MTGHWREQMAAGRTARSEAKILAAALELFRHEPYHSVTVERLAYLAGVQPATVYNRFGSKAMVVGRLLEGPIHLLQDAADADVAAELPAESAIRRHLERMVEVARSDAPLYGALISAAIDAYGSRDGARAVSALRRT